MNKFLVLDLDSTLLHTSQDFGQYVQLELFSKCHNIGLRSRVHPLRVSDIFEPPGTGREILMWTTFRPGLRDFLAFADTYFRAIFIWSAGQPKYVHAIVDLLFPRLLRRPPIVYTHRECVFVGKKIYKPLARLFGDLRALGANATNTWVVDDREDTFSLNPLNGILIPAYEPSVQELRDNDVALPRLQEWLERPDVKMCPDVRSLRSRPVLT